MKSNLKFFKSYTSLPVDKFLQTVLYNKKIGYYNSRNPLGVNGDFVTAPKISRLFSEMIAIWIISTWENIGKPKFLNIVELGPGDGSLIKTLIEILEKFPDFKLSKKRIYLYETSEYLKKIQKKNIKSSQIKWIKNFDKISKGPVIFFGNEFFDAIPIKQFKKEKGTILEKYFFLTKNFNIKEIYKAAKNEDLVQIKSFKTLKNSKFFEFPKLGFIELRKIIKKINELSGCILIIDYGFLKQHNLSTLQSVFKHKRNDILKNLGKADITAHVNFELLKEFFKNRNLKVKEIVTQKSFLEKMGILNRANILSTNMKFNKQADLYMRLKRLLSPRSMGTLFKVILAYDLKNNNFSGFN